eukprot:GHUV01013332.1.p1 GENE.GHUV01013332.1~~GHUV01013332.1.p1  ORF type:complete len:206 (+),score=55.18 GHUV01013332.1:187-804(+)
MSAEDAVAADQEPQQFPQARIDYAIQMRRLFSPPGMFNPDGSINQEFFRPKKVLTLTDRKWGDHEREQLYRGLEKYGVGKWRDIGDDLLHGWDDHNIRVKTAKLLGCQNLSWYHGRKFTKLEAEAEFEQNKQLGAQTGCWKNGMLVDDERGTLRAHFQARQAATAAAAGAAAADEGQIGDDPVCVEEAGDVDMQIMPRELDAVAS